MQKKYFNLLKKLLTENRLNILFVIAPPRSNSTVVEYVLSLSDSIDIVCHEPFIGAHKIDFDPETGYKIIYEKIGGDDFLNSNTTKTLLIKEISQWIFENQEYKYFLSLTKNRILFLIRNPLLSVESRIRRVLKSLNLRPGLSLQQYLLDYFAKKDGFTNFNDGVKNLNFNLILKNTLFFANKLALNGENLYISPKIEIQKFLLDSYAEEFGYLNWDDLIERKTYHEFDYIFFEKILKINLHRNFFEEKEFFSLFKMIDYLDSISKPYVIYDTTDIRINPSVYLNRICKQFSIPFSQKMIDWSGVVKIETDQNRKHEKIWYERLYQSKEIKNPNEIPPSISDFPLFMQKYLLKVDLPIYALLSQKKERISDAKDLNTKQFQINISNENRERLIKLGVINKNVQNTTSPVSMINIDPIYALTNDLALINNPDFLTKKKEYRIEFSQIKLYIKNNSFGIKNEINLLNEIEYIDLVDENNNVIGITDAKTAHEKKQYHRVVAVLLFDNKDKLILQSGTKYNKLEMSVGGHVIHGESYEDAVHREMFEEIMVKTKLSHLSTFLPENNKMGHFWSIYEGYVPEDWEFKETEEVKSIVKVSLEEVFKKIKEEPELFTHGSLNIINEYKKVKNIK